MFCNDPLPNDAISELLKIRVVLELTDIMQAELKHARLAMLGAIGWPASEAFHGKVRICDLQYVVLLRLSCAWCSFAFHVGRLQLPLKQERITYTQKILKKRLLCSYAVMIWNYFA